MTGLTVEGLEFRSQSGLPLLSGVTFTLPQGAVLAIAGPNGAGKTTLMGLLAGVLCPRAGRILAEGQDLAEISAQDRARKIALVTQHGSPDGRLTVRDYVALGQMPIWPQYSRVTHQAALGAILDLTNLTDKSDAPMSRLSGGERQRAHIARALTQRPKLLLLDEPTNHLDPDAKGRMLSLVASLGITVAMVVHDLVMIPEFTTHTALIQGGHLTAFGPTAQVLTPEAVRTTFGVDYLLLPYGDRQVPALDIRKTDIQPMKGTTP